MDHDPHPIDPVVDFNLGLVAGDAAVLRHFLSGRGSTDATTAGGMPRRFISSCTCFEYAKFTAGLFYSHDDRHERMQQAGHTIFFLKSGCTNIVFWQQVQKPAKCFPEILALAQRAKPGDSFQVTVNGKIEPN